LEIGGPHVEVNNALVHITRITEAWASAKPEKSFSGLTLEQFKEAVNPIFVTRAEVAENENRVRISVAKRKDADVAALKLAQSIVHAVKADREEGEDSPLYAAMGYVRKSERSSGLKRPRTVTTEVKPEEQKV
jgi:hypothetical protein